MADGRAYEETVVVGLTHYPRRLADLAGFEPSWFVVSECRLLFGLAHAYHHRSLSQGRTRYAVPAALRREVEAWVKRATPEKKKDRVEVARAAVSLLDGGHPPPADDAFRDAADVVREAAMDRVVCAGILKISEGRRAGADPRGMARQLRDLVASVDGAAKESLVGLLSRDASGALADYDKAKSAPNSGFIATPYTEINRACGGGKYGRYWQVAAYSKQGKSFYAIQLIYHAMIRGRGCLVVTGEQTRSDVRNVLICRHSHKFTPGGLSLREMERGQLTRAQEVVLKKTVQDLASNRYGPIVYEEMGGATISEIKAVAESVARRQKLDVVLVDHTDLFEPTHRQLSDVSRLARIHKELKAMSLDFLDDRGVWVVACQQIKREGYENAIKRGFYIPSDLAGTSEAERSCDVMTWLLRDDRMMELSEARIGVAIDRRGPGIPNGFAVYERLEAAALLEIED